MVLNHGHEGCAGAHLNMIPMLPPDDFEKLPVTETEKTSQGVAYVFRTLGMDYATMQGHKPSTVGLAIGTSLVSRPLSSLAFVLRPMGRNGKSDGICEAAWTQS